MAEQQLDKPGQLARVEISLDECYQFRIELRNHRAIVRIYTNYRYRRSGLILSREQWNKLKDSIETVDAAFLAVTGRNATQQ